MEQTQRSDEYIFQGTMYFYRQKKICCRYQFTLRDPIDPVMLQKAQDAALARTAYYRVQLVWEKRDAYLEPNTNPCPIYAGSEMRQIPEQTNGYLFSVSYEGSTVYFDWYHFLVDGHGVSPFLTQILEEYCNLRYGTAFVCPEIVCSPAYDVKALIERFPDFDKATATESELLQTCEGEMHRTRIRFKKQDLVDAALRCNVKPFSALNALLCLGMRNYFNKNNIIYSYSVDTRKAAGVPDALYNCVASYREDMPLTPSAHLADIARQVDDTVKVNLLPENQLHQMAVQQGWVYKVSQQKASIKIKQRLFQMGEFLGGMPADFWLSYLGNPVMPANKVLEDYITDFQVWVPPDGASIGVEAASINGLITLCIENKAEKPGLAAAMRAAFEQDGIAVLEAVDLDD